MSKKIDLKEGDVFAPKKEFARHNHRRIVGIVKDTVIYSTGGDGRNGACQRKSFMAWRGEKINEAPGFTYALQGAAK